MRYRGRRRPGASAGERVRPPGLGRPFHTLWAATAISNIGDGVVLAAAPLLVASLTDNPALVGWSVFVQQLPWLLFSLLSGVYVDRLERRRLIVVIHLTRATLLGVLAVAVWGDAVGIPLLYTVAFLLGTCETLGDNASASLLPATVRGEDLPRANARFEVLFSVVNQFAAPPLGAALFAVAAAAPFGMNAVTFVVAALLISTLRRSMSTPVRAPARAPEKAPAPGGARRAVLAEMGEGVRWLWGQPLIRLIALVLTMMNITLSAGLSVLVLYATERLGLSEIGYGLLFSAIAAGGLVGALLAARLYERFGPPVLLRGALVLETATHLGLALAGTVWVAGPVLLLFGAHDAVFRVTVRTLRQRAVPDELRGRAESVFLTFARGSGALGALIGGPIVAVFGLTAPFWIALVVMTAVTVIAWRPFGPHRSGTARGGSVGDAVAGQTGRGEGGEQPPQEAAAPEPR
ncbi:MFS-type transporter involved in bile tolerance, Atg22 family [Streptomyces zhaozhouensis]|uniref:MFS-type transporter involved in bile tolerance, Atg22 family n=1 Tax=Streptomyces zhaozhouensis TaxID=1300267 RepID=A0A286DWW6_9ACTN|nr:MFS transporter [Streptomyces zhaozhouensis]SOD63161.1 MFS-type transporter involved in bile tolerance, Atg22 family [Streptomyces zhaozhouensis]